MEEESEFSSACQHVRGLAGSLGNADLLYFYARYKQATEGPCNVPKPSFYQLTEKSKWQAWTDLGDLDSDTAKFEYIERLESLEPEWKGKERKDPTSGWISVSCPVSENKVPEAEKTVWDRVKEGETKVLREILTVEDCRKKDDEGLTLLHWASDRGYTEVADLILDLDKDCLDNQDDDGQSALHYAVSCGHAAMVKLLLSRGADPQLIDSDGISPASTDADPDIKKIFSEIS